MPTYVYRFVDSGETIEVQQAFQDDTLTEIAHPQSGEVMAVKKVFTPVGVTFKGSGFFKTDNRGKKSTSTNGSTTSSSSPDASSSTGTSSSDSSSSTESSTKSTPSTTASSASSTSGASPSAASS